MLFWLRESFTLKRLSHWTKGRDFEVAGAIGILFMTLTLREERHVREDKTTGLFGLTGLALSRSF
jgi:hypothetical protein